MCISVLIHKHDSYTSNIHQMHKGVAWQLGHWRMTGTHQNTTASIDDDYMLGAKLTTL